MSAIINKHKYILDLDPSLHKIIPSESVFVSNRSAKTIKDMLISSKIPRGKSQNSTKNIANEQHVNTINGQNIYVQNEPITISPSINIKNDFGCKACKKCYLCRHYLVECTEFSRYHTTQFFQHRSYIDCYSECIISSS